MYFDNVILKKYFSLKIIPAPLKILFLTPTPIIQIPIVYIKKNK